MRALLRRVSRATVEVNNELVGEINEGLVLYLAIHCDDSEADLEWMIKKVLGIRIFENEDQKNGFTSPKSSWNPCNQSVYSFGNLKKGFKPSFHRAASPTTAEQNYQRFLSLLEDRHPGNVQRGEFGKEMIISAVDQGPVTIWLDSHDKKTIEGEFNRSCIMEDLFEASHLSLYFCL